MLIGAEADAESASSVPDIVASVIVDPVCYSERNSVEEHITAKVFVRLTGHNHNSVVTCDPVGENDNVPVTVVEVDVIVVASESALRAANLLDDGLGDGAVSGENDRVGGVAERLAVFIEHIAELYCQL